MSNFTVRQNVTLLCLSLSAFRFVQIQAARLPVNGSLGQSVSLSMGISHGSKVYEVEWKRLSSKYRIVRWTNGIIKYFEAEEFKKRFKLHPEDLSLQISELQREDTGVYEVSVVLDSGKESSQTVQLDVYESVTGTSITIDQNRRNCNMTLTCSVNTGNHVSFGWWRGSEALRNDSTHHRSKTGEELQLYFTGEPKDSVYRCEARNPVSEDTAQITLRDVCNITVNDSSKLSSVIVPVVLLIIFFLLLVSVFLYLYIRRAGKNGMLRFGKASKAGGEP
ncbi:signaling lymphocytic activation molecule-like isoform X2 [Carcharodon carcharias]|uniref:signaling lymphocytic activation molecule-like isoform X2 n=1 Tax=Carcharodon carcharias TaxID=13397 RepID=UPI001B7EECDD|nr:signaling lymphocytic activation molecule-like isoform X2 [Carcharodon carcharias]